MKTFTELVDEMDESKFRNVDVQLGKIQGQTVLTIDGEEVYTLYKFKEDISRQLGISMSDMEDTELISDIYKNSVKISQLVVEMPERISNILREVSTRDRTKIVQFFNKAKDQYMRILFPDMVRKSKISPRAPLDWDSIKARKN